MQKARFTADQLNALSTADFVRAFGGVFESSPWIAEAVAGARPFPDREALHRAMCDRVRSAGEARQLELIRAHPDLVGRAALAGTLGAESTREQASAGLDRLSAEEVAAFQRCNSEYREKFGFPFVICARLNQKASILAGFAARLKNSRAQEVATALDEIFKIARLRLDDLVAS
jgi:2-oxo-4-hydroxy-4-carboxy-5-ureidoimidazoline decarboxylase